MKTVLSRAFYQHIVLTSDRGIGVVLPCSARTVLCRSTCFLNKRTVLSRCELLRYLLKYNLSGKMSIIEPVQSPNDTRKYRFIKLENGLSAVLISDPLINAGAAEATGESRPNGAAGNVFDNDSGDELDWESDSDEDYSDSDYENDTGGSDTDGGGGRRRSSSRRDSDLSKSSAAALCVGVGSFSDPANIPGLAHFVEHMVFMGSEKYPNENGFDAYLGKHGGSSDAYTDCEQTIFNFDVEQGYFEGALDRFAQFFIHPLMKKDAVDRETEAVDSEFQIGLPKDKNRIEQLLGHMADKNHPMSKFMWGNIETLRTRPKSAGIDIYEHLKEFWKTNYVAQNMTLALQARDSLDQQEKWVRDIFKAIPSSSMPKPSFCHLNKPFQMSRFNKLYKVAAVKNVHQVTLTWALPCTLPYYRVKPIVYLGWLLGHESKGSIDSYLKKRFWAFELEAGSDTSGFDCNSTSTLMRVEVTLSDDGFSHLFEVITVVFEYLSMIKRIGPQHQIFDEIKTIEDCHFRWIEQDEPQDYVQEVALAMQLYEPADILTGNSLLMEYDEKIIKDCMDALTPESVNITLLSDSFRDQESCNLECPWFKTKYSVEDIPIDWIEKWKSVGENPELHLPLPNIYIATDFCITEADAPDSEFPVLISKSPHSRVWYRKDKKFKVPRAFVYVYLTSDCVSRTAESQCMTDLLVKLFENSLTEIAYDADQADLSYSIKVHLNGLVVKLSGFNEKISQLFQVVIDHVVGLTFTGKQLETTKAEWKMIYHNQSIKPSGLNKDLRLSLLVHNHWTMMEKLSTLSSISEDNLATFLVELLSTVTVQMLVQGNISAKEARDLERYLLLKLKFDERQPSAVSQQSDFVVTELPDKPVYFRTKNLNENDDNCVITNYYQHGPASIHDHQLMELLLCHMEEPCFDTLRTNHQLGYVVYCSVRLTHGIVGYSITIGSQSTKFGMKRLDGEIENFLQKFRAKIEKMTSDRFRRLVSSLVSMKLCEDMNMQEEVDRNWYEIVEGTHLFNRFKLEVEQLKQISLPEFKTFSLSHLSPGPRRRKLSMQVIGNQDGGEIKKTTSAPVMANKSAKNIHTGRKQQQQQRFSANGRVKRKSPKKARIDDNMTMNDDKGISLIKNVTAFKASCRKYPVAKIM